MNRPSWLPDAQGFLAIGVLVIVSGIVILLIFGPTTNMKPEILAVITTLIGLLGGSLKDVYSYYFPGDISTKARTPAVTALPASQQPAPEAKP